MPQNSPQPDPQVLYYVRNFELPAERHFLTDQDKKRLETEKRKFDSTMQFAETALNNPQIAEKFDKLSLAGEIYTAAEVVRVVDTMDALEGTGKRIGLSKSAVSPTGQVVIMSDSCAQKLGFISDGHIFVDEVEDLVRILGAEGLPESELLQVKNAANKYGAVILQFGCFVALKWVLQEAAAISDVKGSFETYKHSVEIPKVQPHPEVSHGTSLNALKDRLVVPPQPAVKPDARGIRMTPSEINREVSTKELSAPAPSVPQVPKPVVIPQTPKLTISSPVPDRMPPSMPVKPYQPISSPTLGLPSLKDIGTVQDLKKIEPAHLRQGYLPEQIRFIRSRIAYLAGVNKLLPVQVVGIFEQSPLFKLYLQVGSTLMAESTHDKNADYKQVIARMVNQGKDVLSLQEFEAVADLRKELERM